MKFSVLVRISEQIVHYGRASVTQFVLSHVCVEFVGGVVRYREGSLDIVVTDTFRFDGIARHGAFDPLSFSAVHGLANELHVFGVVQDTAEALSVVLGQVRKLDTVLFQTFMEHLVLEDMVSRLVHMWYPHRSLSRLA